MFAYSMPPTDPAIRFGGIKQPDENLANAQN